MSSSLALLEVLPRPGLELPQGNELHLFECQPHSTSSGACNKVVILPREFRAEQLSEATVRARAHFSRREQNEGSAFERAEAGMSANEFFRLPAAWRQRLRNACRAIQWTIRISPESLHRSQFSEFTSVRQLGSRVMPWQPRPRRRRG